MKTFRLIIRIILSPLILVINAIPLAVFPSIVAPAMAICLIIRAAVVPEAILFPNNRRIEMREALLFGTCIVWVPFAMTWSWITEGKFGSWQ